MIEEEYNIDSQNETKASINESVNMRVDIQMAIEEYDKISNELPDSRHYLNLLILEN